MDEVSALTLQTQNYSLEMKCCPRMSQELGVSNGIKPDLWLQALSPGLPLHSPQSQLREHPITACLLSSHTVGHSKAKPSLAMLSTTNPDSSSLP